MHLSRCPSFRENDVSLGAGESDYDMRSYLATVFARYEQDRLFADSPSAAAMDYRDLPLLDVSARRAGPAGWRSGSAMW
ncbi:hypothetical protein FEV13_11400 [Stutzerimonas degradans]|nr:hypothetical protein FEV13_11400 [Stutzerimonas degradans]